MKECFDDMSTIENSVFENKSQINVTETYDRKESLNYFQSHPSYEYNNCIAFIRSFSSFLATF